LLGKKGYVVVVVVVEEEMKIMVILQDVPSKYSTSSESSIFPSFTSPHR